MDEISWRTIQNVAGILRTQKSHACIVDEDDMIVPAHENQVGGDLDDFAMALLALRQRLGGSPTVGDIVGEHDERAAAVKHQRIDGDFGVNRPAVTEHMTPCSHVPLALRRLLDLPQQGRAVLGRAYVGDGHSEKLGSGIAIMRDCGVVHSKEAQRFAFKNPHGMRVGVEEATIAEFIVAKRSLDPPANRAIAQNEDARERHEHDGSDDHGDRVAPGGRGTCFAQAHLCLLKVVHLLKARADHVMEPKACAGCDMQATRLEASIPARRYRDLGLGDPCGDQGFQLLEPSSLPRVRRR